jgi:hypothetical protein
MEVKYFDILDYYNQPAQNLQYNPYSANVNPYNMQVNSSGYTPQAYSNQQYNQPNFQYANNMNSTPVYQNSSQSLTPINLSIYPKK